MAAHILTGIKQTLAMLREDPDKAKPQITAALELSCWTEDDFQVWQQLRDWVDGTFATKSLIEWLDFQIWHFWDLYYQLGEPDTREEWSIARFDGLDALKEYRAKRDAETLAALPTVATRINPGEKVLMEVAFSEAAMHLGAAGKVMTVGLTEGEYPMAQLYRRDGGEKSFPITYSEAGFYRDDAGFYYYPRRSRSV